MSQAVPWPFTGVKLVVWDLDDTFWHGTLGEGEITWVPRHERLVRALAAAGIVNSVCSNNDHARAESVLRAHGVWELMVFPRIAWNDKAWMLGEQIAAAGLRPQDTAFVDDNPRVREAVRQRHPDVRIVPSDALSEVDAGAIPVLDPRLERLARYRLLERKAGARSREAPMTDQDFLRSSRIRVVLDEAPAAHRRRVLELLQRTNQLNFTKVRLDGAGLDAVLEDRRLRTGAVRVMDRFGDYGVSGFYALDEAHGRLRHFLFSCRVLNMGIEQFVWRHLGCPALDVVRPVASDPRAPAAVDWVAIGDGGGRPGERPADEGGQSLLMKGGCDLLAMQIYLQATHGGGPALHVDWEVLDRHAGVQRYGHSALSVLLAVGEAAHAGSLDRLPWLGNWRTRLYSGTHRCVCLSLWVDYACTRYRHRDTGLVVPLFEPLTTSTPEAVWRYWWGPHQQHRAWFERSFVPIGPLSPPELQEQLLALRRRIPSRTRLVVLNGAEVDKRFSYPWGGRAADRHRDLNAALDEIAGAHAIDVLDVRRRVRGPRELLDMQTHYSRRASFALACDLRELIGLDPPEAAASRPKRGDSA